MSDCPTCSDVRGANNLLRMKLGKTIEERDSLRARVEALEAAVGGVSGIVAEFIHAEEAAQHEACPWPSARDAMYQVARALRVADGEDE